jgi:hypothetical protein
LQSGKDDVGVDYTSKFILLKLMLFRMSYEGFVGGTRRKTRRIRRKPYPEALDGVGSGYLLRPEDRLEKCTRVRLPSEFCGLYLLEDPDLDRYLDRG